MTQKSVLVVEDEENILEAIKYSLEREGYDVLTAFDGGDGLNQARQALPDLVILDIMLPTIDGFEVCRILRRETDIPIMILTARGEEIDRVVGLELGADDYVTKPFSMRELTARVRNMLRRTQSASDSSSISPPPSEIIKSGNLLLDITSHTATIDDKPLQMKPREFELLSFLAFNKGRAFTRDQILERLWGHDYIGDTRTVDVHVRWLREKIEADPGRPIRIVTIRGVGYRFDG